MARADLLVDLIHAARAGDQDQLRRGVETLIAEEEGKHHHLLAERLRRAMEANGHAPARSAALEEAPPGIQRRTPRRTLGELVLPDLVVDSCRELLEEQHRLELLRAHGLEPRHRMLVLGPPGTGKTTLAEGLAEALMVPLVVIRYELVIGSFLGETGARLAQLFDWARSRRCVLFLDEFDAIAKERGDIHETGEVKRVVSSLLMLIDEMPAHTVVVAASNHPELLDRAVERRFELVLKLPAPNQSARAQWWTRFLERLDVERTPSAKTLASETPAKNFSELEDLGTDIRRQLVMRLDATPSKVIKERISLWEKRRKQRG